MEKTTKARTKGQRLRDKKKSAFDIPAIQRREPNGRRRPPRSAEDPTMVVLTARARKIGASLDPRSISMLRDTLLCDPAGHAIHIECKATEAKALGLILASMTNAYVSMCRALQIAPFAKCGKLEYLPERFEARDDDRPDLRTPEERDRAAIRAWRQWDWAIEQIPRYMQHDLWDGIHLRRDLTRDGQTTLAGRAFVCAMRTLRQVRGE